MTALNDLRFPLLAAFVAAFCFFSPVAFAQQAEPPADITPDEQLEADAGEADELDEEAFAALPDELLDAAFARYMDIDFLRAAWQALDAAALADAGLQLAEGERVLFRSHGLL